MTLFDCIQRAVDDPEIAASKERGERAQKMWRERADQYEREGHPRNAAEELAAEDVKEAFRREAGEKRHIYLAVASYQRKAQAIVANAKKPNMVRTMEKLDYRHRGMVRWFNGRLGAYLKEHHRDLLGRITNPAQQADIANELHGISTGNAAARELAEGITATLEDMRIMFNEAGGMISKLDNWGLPHVHNRVAVMRAGFDNWFREIDGRLDWGRITDPMSGRVLEVDQATGMPPLETRQRYLKEAFDNIVFNKDADDAIYGRPKGVATYRKHMDQRHLHFKSGQDWMDYNRDFGTGGIHASLMGHVHRMARDIVLMREFGPNPKLGAEYMADLWRQKAKQAGDTSIIGKLEFDTSHALRMMNVMSGGNVPQDPMQQWVATTMSSLRNVVGSAFLDRAIVASFSDLNTMRMAAKSMGMNPSSLIKKQLGMMKTLSKDELLRAQWVADTQADAGTAVARFQQEVAPAEWAERVMQMSMRIQGLSAWTDRARATAYSELSGWMASQADRPLSDTEPGLRALLAKWDVTPEEWDDFRRPEHLFRADNGATFAMPIHYRGVRGNSEIADRVFFKIGGAAEEFLELAVPTRSLFMQGFIDPASRNIEPGSIAYEIIKSGTMFKSFPLTFTINQYRQIMERGGFFSREGALYGLDLAAGATIMGALSIQIGDLTMGRDPQDMTDPDFWIRAALKGGGLGIVGDIASTGQASWGGGFASYAAGPGLQTAQDVWGLTIGNAFDALGQLMRGEEVDVNFAQDLARFGKRYTPMGQTPIIGPALDRLFWDRLQLLLDPDSADALVQSSKKRQRDYGQAEFWLPGSPSPYRAPNLASAFGQ